MVWNFLRRTLPHCSIVHRIEASEPAFKKPVSHLVQSMTVEISMSMIRIVQSIKGMIMILLTMMAIIIVFNFGSALVYSPWMEYSVVKFYLPSESCIGNQIDISPYLCSSASETFANNWRIILQLVQCHSQTLYYTLVVILNHLQYFRVDSITIWVRSARNKFVQASSNGHIADQLFMPNEDIKNLPNQCSWLLLNQNDASASSGRLNVLRESSSVYDCVAN